MFCIFERFALLRNKKSKKCIQGGNKNEKEINRNWFANCNVGA